MALQWYQWHTVTERLQARLYALTKGSPYRFAMDISHPSGCCDFTHKMVKANPLALDEVFEQEHMPKKQRDQANYLITRSIVGHEALHIKYSDPGVLMGSIRGNEDMHNIINLLEDARIEAIGSEESTISKNLFKLTNSTAYKLLPEFTDPNLSNPYSGLELLLMWRLGFAIPELEKEARKKWIQIRNLAEDAKYAPTCHEVLACAKRIYDILGLKQQQNQENDLKNQLNRAIEKMKSQMEGNNSSGTDKPSKSPLQRPQQGSGKDEGDKSNPSGKNDKSDTQDGQDQDQSKKGEPDQSDPNGGQNPTDVNIAKLVNEIGSEVQEDVASIIPQGDVSAALTAGAKGGCQSIHGAPYVHIYERAKPIAQYLEKELKGEDPRAVTGASQYPGRFKGRYYLRNDQRPFSQQRFRGMLKPDMALTLVLDRSGSMKSMLYDLQTMTMAIYLACEKLKIPLSIWALEGEVHVKEFNEWGPTVMAKIAGIAAWGGTHARPTLNRATADLKKRKEPLKQIVLIHDGYPHDGEQVVFWRRSALSGIGLYCMYITNRALEAEYGALIQRKLEELMGPRNYVMALVAEVAKYWCSYMKTKSKAYSTAA